MTTRTVPEPFIDSDPRTITLTKTIIRADMTDEDQTTVLSITQTAIEKYVLLPTKSSWRKSNKEDPDWSRQMLEREVERTSLRDICYYIKRELDSRLGPLWHVVYGRSLSAYVTSECLSFLHFSIDDADVVVWRHGR
eukprot:Tbor_TRINITY_DN5378_c5_g3::TRINITY_DN5378_c5_g3_i2::g.3994::m.3994/K10418/DYNLL; dynein light chain LC8-type